MSLRDSDERVRFETMLDRLRVTPQRFLDLQHDIGRDAVIFVEELQPVVIRPRKTPWLLQPFYRINPDTLDQKLRAMLNATGVGYCYMMRRRGTLLHLGASGFAQLGSDGPISWAPHIPMNMASVSKFVTAIAIVRLLRANNLPLTTAIGSFLPQHWKRGTASDAVTFHELLRHEAGFTAGTTGTDPGRGDYAVAMSEIAKGPTASLVGNFIYRNVNFAILRILFATLTGTLTPASKPPSFLNMTDDTFWDLASGIAYENTVNDTVFAAASIDPRDHSAQPNAALAYATPPAAPGARIVDGFGGSGPSGWHLTIGELARLLNEFRAGAMMSRSQARQILTRRYGLDLPIPTSAGNVHWKRGRKMSGLQGMDSGVWLMPGDIDLAVYINSVPAFTPPAQPPSYNDGISQLIIDSVEFVL
jgi:hypothetical protein